MPGGPVSSFSESCLRTVSKAFIASRTVSGLRDGSGRSCGFLEGLRLMLQMIPPDDHGS